MSVLVLYPVLLLRDQGQCHAHQAVEGLCVVVGGLGGLGDLVLSDGQAPPPWLPLSMLMSEQALNSSWGPQPTWPLPSGHSPQLLPATYLHCSTHWAQLSPAGSRSLSR